MILNPKIGDHVRMANEKRAHKQRGVIMGVGALQEGELISQQAIIVCWLQSPDSKHKTGSVREKNSMLVPVPYEVTQSYHHNYVVTGGRNANH